MAASFASVPEFEKNDRFGAAERRDLVERLAQLHLRLVVEIRARHVQELLRLIDDGGDDGGMGVAGGVDGDAGGAIEEQVAVDVLDDGAGAAGHDEGIAARVGRRHDLAVALDDGFGFGAGQGGLDQRRVHALIIRSAGQDG